MIKMNSMNDPVPDADDDDDDDGNDDKNPISIIHYTLIIYTPTHTYVTRA